MLEVEIQRRSGQRERLAVRRMVQAKIADLDEAFWQDMLKETVQEFKDRQIHLVRLACIGVPITKRDRLIVVMKDARVGQSDTVDVTGEIFQGIAAVCDILDVQH